MIQKTYHCFSLEENYDSYTEEIIGILTFIYNPLVHIIYKVGMLIRKAYVSVYLYLSWYQINISISIISR